MSMRYEHKGNINRYGCMRNDLCMDEVVVVESMAEKYHNACQKQWHTDAMAVPTHLKTVCSPFPNYYHPDGSLKVKEEKNEYRRNYHETCHDD